MSDLRIIIIFQAPSSTNDAKVMHKHTSRMSGPSTTLSPTTTFILGALDLISGGWSLTGVTVMLNISVTAALSLTR